MGPLSVDLRKRVMAEVDAGKHINEVAKTFKVGSRTIYGWLALRKQTGSLSPKIGYQNGHSHKITDWDLFRKFAEKHRLCSGPKMAEEWKKLTGVDVSDNVIYRALEKINYTSKKNI